MGNDMRITDKELARMHAAVLKEDAAIVQRFAADLREVASDASMLAASIHCENRDGEAYALALRAVEAGVGLAWRICDEWGLVQLAEDSAREIVGRAMADPVSEG